MSRGFSLSAGGWVLLLVLSASCLYACGPWFPNRVLVEGDSFLREAPVASFDAEIKQIRPPGKARLKAMPPPADQWGYIHLDDYAKQVARVDVADLEKALRARGVADPPRKVILDRYRAARKAFTDSVGSSVTAYPKPPPFVPPAVPAEIPAEFADYLRGAIHFQQDQMKEAREDWLALLARPARERHYRSTWAAFMIGRSLLDESPAEAMPWFHRTRQLVVDGFPDSLGLVVASLGWEAQAFLRSGNYNRAIELYVEQLAAGDPTAPMSLQRAARRALKASVDTLAEAAQHPTTRRVITAYIISLGGPFEPSPPREMSERWASAVARAGLSSAQDADRLAWAAYQTGEMELAQKWLRLAPRDSATARWLRAKLLIRAGRVGKASYILEALAARFPPGKGPYSEAFSSEWGVEESRWHMGLDPIGECVRGELGMLRFARQQYVGALDALLKGGFWEDSAYVAERVLTADELKTYIDHTWPTALQSRPQPAGGTGAGGEAPTPLDYRVTYLLARRLARIGRWAEARAYYPPEWRPRFDIYAGGVAVGRNTQLPQQRRAEALWKAARVARQQGMELLGAELEPDWSIYEGSYGSDQRTPAGELRQGKKSSRLIPFATSERRRLQRHLPRPNTRFHYRYTAANLAWEAARLMPDQSDKTARVLTVAGTWLKNRDPKAADRFYKALVRRCGKTSLGREAARRRWFPPVDSSREELQ